MSYTENDRVCCDCIGERYLSAEISTKGRLSICSFCHQENPTYSLRHLTKRIEKVILEHYETTPSEPSEWEYFRQHVIEDSDYYWTREGQTLEELLSDEFDIESEIVGWISEVLYNQYYDPEKASMYEENEFGSEVRYELKGISDECWIERWSDFERELKTESRFFSKKATEHLDAVFEGLEKFRTRRKRKVLTKVGPSEKINAIYRARVFQSKAGLFEGLCSPDKQLGSPPSRYATSGRMNAAGISVFYGATAEEVTLAEVRPPVGAKVATARFELLRDMQLLDL